MVACICGCVKAMETIVSLCVCVCWGGGGGDIYVFYYCEGGGVKSPDPELYVCYCRLPVK